MFYIKTCKKEQLWFKSTRFFERQKNNGHQKDGRDEQKQENVEREKNTEKTEAEKGSDDLQPPKTDLWAMQNA